MQALSCSLRPPFFLFALPKRKNAPRPVYERKGRPERRCGPAPRRPRIGFAYARAAARSGGRRASGRTFGRSGTICTMSAGVTPSLRLRAKAEAGTSPVWPRGQGDSSPCAFLWHQNPFLSTRKETGFAMSSFWLANRYNSSFCGAALFWRFQLCLHIERKKPSASSFFVWG